MDSSAISSEISSGTPSKKAILRFGVVADVQYADSDDRQAWYNPAKRRYYRNSLEQVRKAFTHWESYRRPEVSEPEVSFILQLGDIIDALNSGPDSHGAIHKTLENFLNNPHMPTFHTVGNHELYNFNRPEMSLLFDRFLFSRPEVEHNRQSLTCPLYYKFSPYPGVKFLSLDVYDISVLGYDKDHSRYLEAAEILHKHHGVTDWDIWDTDKNLVGENRRFQSSNGAIGPEQLAWLESELEDSDRKNETVIVFGHVGLHPGSCGWDSMLWNYDQVLEIFSRHSCIAAYFSGHAHNAGYAFHDNIHYVVFHGIIETHPEFDAFATVSLFSDSIYIDGRGVEEQRILPLRKPIPEPQNSGNLGNSGHSVDNSVIVNDIEIVSLEPSEPIKV